MLEKPVQLGIDALDDAAEVLLIVFEVDLVGVDDEQVALFVVVNPLLVFGVEALEIHQAHVALVFAAARVDVLDERGDTGLQKNQEIGRLNLRSHQLKQAEVIAKIAGTHQAHFVEIGRKNVCVLIDRAILNDGLVAFLDVDNLLEAVVQKIYLQVERPARHVEVKILQVGVVVGGLEVDFPAKMMGQRFGERGFAGADIAGDGDVPDPAFGHDGSVLSLVGKRRYKLSIIRL